ncbi:MAG: hypothetical protein LBU51_09685 [Bacteroidales bacterium]|jgi:hypothetical protein|nr:hypothetical protein [Bacteroidales bacterium]
MGATKVRIYLKWVKFLEVLFLQNYKFLGSMNLSNRFWMIFILLQSFRLLTPVTPGHKHPPLQNIVTPHHNHDCHKHMLLQQALYFPFGNIVFDYGFSRKLFDN